MVSPVAIQQYHVFLASPGDMDGERKIVRRFFDSYNRSTARHWGIQFEVIDWENHSTIGVGRPQQLITEQTLERFRDSLALVIGLMGQRFGSSSGEAESGTEEEFNWALETHQQTGFPEIKWFFRRIDEFRPTSTTPSELRAEADQWERVLIFRERISAQEPPLFFKELAADDFKDVFQEDLSLWLGAPERVWVQKAPPISKKHSLSDLEPPDAYYQSIHDDFHRLDISGVDSDKAFDIPLSDIYVRLRVMFEESDDQCDTPEAGTLIDIQTALKNYKNLAIVGDPGSGKSTFLKYIALMIARSILEADTKIAVDALDLEPPLPIPIFVSCWDLSDFLKERDHLDLDGLIAFLADRATASGFSLHTNRMTDLLNTGNCCLLFDGLDEVPTDKGRAVVSRLLEKVVRRFGQNRFVVTSRIRAYTGDTILRGEFTRCDIQPFNEDDRRLFLRNWVSLLFRLPRDEDLPTQSAARAEFDNLTGAIEKSDRIRELAVNPLLLTVIAIVYWNRKRLPEQRVDLYDECVDVLLGQRKQAERSRYMRSGDVLDETTEAASQQERAWVRKRFAEIALLILESEDEEVTKKDVVELLRPRFRNRGAKDDDEAEAQSERFLDQQELRSGLLVSRRASNYRFVHLTFEEYLAAWHLSNQSFEATKKIIQPHLREQTWFETLQLLAGEWAKQSDEKLDGYVAWLLQQRGKGIAAQAPIVALCANAVRDTTGIAELKPETRKAYENALRETLHAFRSSSKVSNKVQLEILEALGKLGASVKAHLVAATRSRNFDVRKRAIEMLMPHLSDDDLFQMKYILNDRSKYTILIYLLELSNRDLERTTEFLLKLDYCSNKTLNAYFVLLKTQKNNLKNFVDTTNHLLNSSYAGQLSCQDLGRIFHCYFLFENADIKSAIKLYFKKWSGDRIVRIYLERLEKMENASESL